MCYCMNTSIKNITVLQKLYVLFPNAVTGLQFTPYNSHLNYAHLNIKMLQEKILTFRVQWPKIYKNSINKS